MKALCREVMIFPTIGKFESNPKVIARNVLESAKNPALTNRAEAVLFSLEKSS